MTSVVIIHAQEDALPARALAEKLRLSGFTPLVEQTGREGFHQTLRDAAAIVALWSPRSVVSPELVDEASFARGLGPILHVRMQNAANPAPFDGEFSIDLTGWRGEDDFASWRDLIKAVAQRAGVPEPAAPAPRQANPFFQPGPARATPVAAEASGRSADIHAMPPRPAPPRPAPARPMPAQMGATSLSEERLAPIRPLSEVSRSEYATPRSDTASYAPVEPKSSGGGKLALIGGITFLAVAAVGLGGYFVWDRVQSGQSADAAWSQLDTSSPTDLEAFLAAHHGSSHESEAQRRLTALDGQGFQHARTADTIEAFQRYLSDFPDGENVLAARGRIAELRQMPAPAAPLTPAVDPETGLPIDPTAPEATENPDLAPPGIDMGETPDSTGGPVPLAPPPTNTPAPAPSPPTTP